MILLLFVFSLFGAEPCDQNRRELTVHELQTITGGDGHLRCERCVCNSDLSECECTNCTIFVSDGG